MEEHKYTLVTIGGQRETVPVASIDEAKEIAWKAGSNSFFLIPQAQGTHWRGYILEGEKYHHRQLARVFQIICPDTIRIVDEGEEN